MAVEVVIIVVYVFFKGTIAVAFAVLWSRVVRGVLVLRKSQDIEGGGMPLAITGRQ